MATEYELFTEKRSFGTVDRFDGIKNADHASDGELLAAQNMCSNAYPAVTSSPSRRRLSFKYAPSASCSVGADETLFYSSNGSFIYGDSVRGSLTPGRKKFAVLDDAIAIFPDNVYFSHKVKYYFYEPYSAIGMIEIPANDAINSAVELIAMAYVEPETANEGDMFFNTLDLKLYTYVGGVWKNPTTPDFTAIYSSPINEYDYLTHKFTWGDSSEDTLHVKCQSLDGDEGNECIKITFYRNDTKKRLNFAQFQIGDRVSVRGLVVSDTANVEAIARLAAGAKITAIGSVSLTLENEVGAIDADTWLADGAGPVTFERVMPMLDCVTRSGDRLWGAKGSFIYGSAPHDLTRWGEGNAPNTTVTLESGVSGNIIGCADFGGVPTFFTENAIISVLEVYNGYKVSITPAPSLSKDNPDSIAYVSGALYYLSDSGVMCYTGSSPKKIEFEHGESLRSMLGGTDGVKYYLSGMGRTYVYDPRNSTWYSEDGEFVSFAKYGSDIVGVSEENGECKVCLLGNVNLGEGADEQFENKMIEFAPCFEGTVSKKTYTKLTVKAKATLGTSISVSVSYDGNGFCEIGQIKGSGKLGIYEIPLLPTRADYIQIRIEAPAKCDITLFSLTREFILHENYN